MTTFLAFLRETKNLLKWKPKLDNMLYIVIGNESCDLDSAVCAITLAYLYKSNEGNKDFLPVLNIPRNEYPIKTEVNYLFEKFNIKAADHLIFRDDLSPELLTLSHFILVDHHISPYADRVDEVIDHRPYNLANDKMGKHCKRHIVPVGSCATLIAERYLNDADNKSHVCSHTVNSLLHHTIILDTINLSENAGRTSINDVCMINKLEKLAPGMCERRNIIFNELVGARSDVTKLNTSQLLLKDLKIIEGARGMGKDTIKVALPGFPMTVQYYVKQANAEAAIRQFASSNKCCIVVLLGMYVRQGTNEVERDIGIITTEPGYKELCEQIKFTLITTDKPAFLLEPQRNCTFMSGTFYRQVNLAATRKHIMPIIKDAIDNWVKSKAADLLQNQK